MSAGVLRSAPVAGALFIALTIAGCASTRAARTTGETSSLAGEQPAAGAPGAPGEQEAGEEAEGLRQGEELTLTPINVNVKDVEQWQLSGPFPTVLGEVPHAPTDHWEQTLQAVVDQKPGVAMVSESMTCAAREFGRFYLAQQAQPSDELRRYILGRCGAAVASVSVAYLGAQAPEAVSEKKVFEEWKDALPPLIDKHLGSGSRATGIWFGQQDGRVLLLLASGERQVQVRPTATTPDAHGNVVIEGEMLVPAARLEVMATKDRLGVVDCELDESVSLPRFLFRCPVQPGDRQAWIEVESYPSGRLLPSEALSVLVWPAQQPGQVYQRPRYSSSTNKVTDAAQATLELFRQLNQVRQAAGVMPLELAEQESKLSIEASPHFFGALAGLTPEILADAIILGLEEGNSVDEEVSDSTFTYEIVTYSADPARLLSAVLERPSGREALLNPKLRQVAIGPVVFPEEGMIAVIFTGYMTDDKNRREARAKGMRSEAGPLTWVGPEERLRPRER